MADDTTTKKIVITGIAAEHLSPLSTDSKNDSSYDNPIKKGGRTRKKNMNSSLAKLEIKKIEGAGMSPGTVDQLASTRVSGSGESRGTVPPVDLVPQGIQKIGGNVKEQNVILAKSAKVKRVFLSPAPPKNDIPIPKRTKTMKRVKVGGLRIRIKKAKTIKKKSLNKNIKDIKTELSLAGLVKDDSKAPDDILRQMHTDFMVLKGRAL
jgi:hypothetical protein